MKKNKYPDWKKREIFRNYEWLLYERFMLHHLKKPEFFLVTDSFIQELNEYCEKHPKYKFQIPTFIKDTLGNIHCTTHNCILTDEMIDKQKEAIEEEYGKIDSRNIQKGLINQFENLLKYMDWNKAFNRLYNHSQYGVNCSNTSPNSYTTHPEEYHEKNTLIKEIQDILNTPEGQRLIDYSQMPTIASQFTRNQSRLNVVRVEETEE